MMRLAAKPTIFFTNKKGYSDSEIAHIMGVSMVASVRDALQYPKAGERFRCELNVCLEQTAHIQWSALGKSNGIPFLQKKTAKSYFSTGKQSGDGTCRVGVICSTSVESPAQGFPLAFADAGHLTALMSLKKLAKAVWMALGRLMLLSAKGLRRCGYLSPQDGH